MNGLELGLRLLAGLFLILANGFFVAIEFALTRVRQYPESEFDEPGLRRAIRVDGAGWHWCVYASGFA